ncbi:MAG: hypothetical protein JNL69_08000, partial [Bacteroidia bacterium]|nr:hypothetical protein [Bacteroidia bacterium]
VTTLSRLDTLVPSGLASVPLPLPQGNVYKYDQLNRITESKTYNNIDLPNNHWLSSGQTISNMYTNNFTYEANGNILTQTRYDNLGAQHDNMVYRYWKDASGDMIHNRLYHVNDNTAYTSLRTDDIDDQGYYTNHEDSVNVYNNYSYDAIGNLVKDSTEQIDSIEWTVYGKIKRITRVTGSTKDNLAFDYDASGNRIAKHILDNSNQWKRTTYYVRDAQGNVMSTYEHTIDDTVLSYAQTEKHLYGSSRLGMDNTENEMLGAVASADATPIPHYQGYKRYELSNHLGNVMSTITDRKIAVDTVGNDTISFYIADIMSQYDYYPFGVIKTNRLCTYDTVGTITDTLLYEPFDSGTGGFTTVCSTTLSNSSSQLQATCTCAFKGQHSFGASKEISLTNGVSYTISYSLDVVCGASIRVILKNPSGVAVDSTVKTSTGTYTINYTPSSSGTYNLEFYKLSPGSACGFLIDNLLVTSLGYDVVADCDGIEGFGNYRYGMNGMEKDDEIVGSGNMYTTAFRENDVRLGKWWGIDPLSAKYPWQSPYASMDNNPVNKIDPSGMGTTDFVKDKAGNIKWDNNANSQETTKEGETYLGKELTFKFNSFIDGKLWDGPNPPPGFGEAAGDKLTSTIKLSATENEKGELTGLTATHKVKIGETPIGTARDFYPGKGGSNNIFAQGSAKNADGTLGGYSMNFEQHASVSPIEEYGINMNGFKIVDVAQKLNLTYSGGILKVNSYTDIFPSATLDVNGLRVMYYPQPSFKATHEVKLNIDKPWNNGTPALNYGYYPATFYKR